MVDRSASDVRELDARRSDGIEVRLLWCESEDRVMVTVEDRRAGGRFTVDVRQDESPLDVFRHPYAYAVWHGTPTTDVAPDVGSRAA